MVIDFGFIAGSRAVLYLGPNQSVSLTTSQDLPAGGGGGVYVHVSEREIEKERDRESLTGSCRRLC